MLDKTKIVFLVVFIQLNFVVGWSQENQRSINNTIMERPIITPEFEKLNLDDFKDGLKITKIVGDTMLRPILWTNIL